MFSRSDLQYGSASLYALESMFQKKSQNGSRSVNSFITVFLVNNIALNGPGIMK